MGTRGFVGFAADGREVIAYNHFDSYPSGVGVAFLKWLTGVASGPESLAETRARVTALGVVPDGAPLPTEPEIDRLHRYADLDVGGRGGPIEWYQLLRNTQGNPEAILDAGLVEDASDFPLDSLFCEWGYLADFDANAFEVYRGFQEAPHDKGRFARQAPQERASGSLYWPVALLASWPMDALPEEEDFLRLERSGPDDED